jgi:hypothetical protein
VPVDVFVSDLRQNILTSEFLTTVKIPILFWVMTPFELAVDIKISEKTFSSSSGHLALNMRQYVSPKY